MFFGRRDALTPDDRDAFAISGTAHLLAISGLHIQLVCALFWRMLGWAGLSRRKSAGWVLAGCAAYCLLTGSSPPAVRATVMFAAYVAATFFQREAEPLSALASAALIILSYSPHDLFSVGFQLSFLAVLSLHTLLPVFENAWEKFRERNRPSIDLEPNQSLSAWTWLRQWAFKSILVTLAAWLATSPAVAWHMGRFSTLGLFVNLFALPLLTACMAAGFITLVLGLIWISAGQIAGYASFATLWLLEEINAKCAAVPFASIDMPAPPVIILILFAAALIWLWIANGPHTHFIRTFFVVPACVLLLLSTLLFRVRPTTPELTILDVTRGRAALIETPQGAALIDAGGKGQGLRIAELLRRRGIHSLALLVLTSDEPGALGGGTEIVSRIRCGRVLLPRCKFPSESRRALEALLIDRGISYGSPDPSEKISGPASVSWEFMDDGPAATAPASNTTTLAVRVTFDALKALFVEARSSPSLGRLLAKSQSGFEADVLRLLPGEFGRWPRETNELVHRSKTSLIVAGSFASPDETPGVDFEKIQPQILSPHRDGSVRIRANSAGQMEVNSFRGEWQPPLAP